MKQILVQVICWRQLVAGGDADIPEKGKYLESSSTSLTEPTETVQSTLEECAVVYFAR